MGVEGEVVLVPLACAVIASTLLHEMTEKPCGVFVVHALRMPLHTKDALEDGALHGFDGAITGKTYGTELCACVCHCLVMEAVDEDFSAEELSQEGVFQ